MKLFFSILFITIVFFNITYAQEFEQNQEQVHQGNKEKIDIIPENLQEIEWVLIDMYLIEPDNLNEEQTLIFQEKQSLMELAAATARAQMSFIFQENGIYIATQYMNGEAMGDVSGVWSLEANELSIISGNSGQKETIKIEMYENELRFLLENGNFPRYMIFIPKSILEK